jgi:hypothetical protein
VNLNTSEGIKARIGCLQEEHAGLERQLEHAELSDDLQIKQVKKRKLLLKDMIARLEQQLERLAAPELEPAAVVRMARVVPKLAESLAEAA